MRAARPRVRWIVPTTVSTPPSLPLPLPIVVPIAIPVVSAIPVVCAIPVVGTATLTTIGVEVPHGRLARRRRERGGSGPLIASERPKRRLKVGIVEVVIAIAIAVAAQGGPAILHTKLAAPAVALYGGAPLTDAELATVVVVVHGGPAVA